MLVAVGSFRVIVFLWVWALVDYNLVISFSYQRNFLVAVVVVVVVMVVVF